MGMGQGLKSGLGHEGLTCVLQTQFFSLIRKRAQCQEPRKAHYLACLCSVMPPTPLPQFSMKTEVGTFIRGGGGIIRKKKKKKKKKKTVKVLSQDNLCELHMHNTCLCSLNIGL